MPLPAPVIRATRPVRSNVVCRLRPVSIGAPYAVTPSSASSAACTSGRRRSRRCRCWPGWTWWQGTTMAIGFRPLAWPTALEMPFVAPTRRASSPSRWSRRRGCATARSTRRARKSWRRRVPWADRTRCACREVLLELRGRLLENGRLLVPPAEARAFGSRRPINTSPSASRTICPIGVSNGMVAVRAVVVVMRHVLSYVGWGSAGGRRGQRPKVGHGVAAPGAPVFGELVQVHRVVGQAQRHRGAPNAEVRRQECAVSGAPAWPLSAVHSPIRARHQRGAHFGLSQRRRRHAMPPADRLGQRHQGAAPAAGTAKAPGSGAANPRAPPGREQVGDGVHWCTEWITGGQHQASGHGPRPGDRDLLPEDGAHGELEAVRGSRHPAPGFTRQNGPTSGSRGVLPRRRRGRRRGPAAAGSAPRPRPGRAVRQDELAST